MIKIPFLGGRGRVEAPPPFPLGLDRVDVSGSHSIHTALYAYIHQRACQESVILDKVLSNQDIVFVFLRFRCIASAGVARKQGCLLTSGSTHYPTSKPSKYVVACSWSCSLLNKLRRMPIYRYNIIALISLFRWVLVYLSVYGYHCLLKTLHNLSDLLFNFLTLKHCFWSFRRLMHVIGTLQLQLLIRGGKQPLNPSTLNTLKIQVLFHRFKQNQTLALFMFTNNQRQNLTSKVFLKIWLWCNNSNTKRIHSFLLRTNLKRTLRLRFG